MTDTTPSAAVFRRTPDVFSRAFARLISWFGTLAFLLVLFACQLGSAPETNRTFDFPTLKGKIGEADYVVITLRDSSGKLIDVLFDDSVDADTRFEDLTAPNYTGGKVYIHIEATKGGQTLYKVQRGYDPARGGDIAAETIVLVDPTKPPTDTTPVITTPQDTAAKPRLILQPDTLLLAVRGPTGRFTAAFLPDSSAGPLTWSSLDAGVEVTSGGEVTAKAQGISRVVAASQAHASAKDTVYVRVLPVQAVDSIRFEKRATNLLVQGPLDSFRLRVFPALAPQGVVYTVRDTAIVRLMGGALQGLKEGETRVYANSTEDPAKRDSLAVVVLSPKPADSLRIQQDTVKLFVKGPGQALTARIYPTDLAQLILWSSQDPAIAAVDAQGLVAPVSQGQTQVVARAWADSTRQDRAIVVVKKDTPRILVGTDTILARGATLVHSPTVTQEFGQVSMFKWDLDGNGAYDDSATAVRSNLSHTYAEAKEYAVRFYVRDTEGNDTMQVRKVKAVSGRVVQITSPLDGSATNAAVVTVTWSVDGASQSNTETLRAGQNVITRSAQDSAGNIYSHSITVLQDQTAPQRPVVMGPALPINHQLPRWSWKSGDTSGSGTYRYRLDTADLAATPTVTDTVFIPGANLSEGAHTLYVQERDRAGNWSASGSFQVRIDITPPATPAVQTQPASPTSETRPTWTWSGGAGNALQYYRFKLDDNDFRTGAKDTVGTGYRPPAALAEGTHTLYVQARDSAGNWSASGSVAVRIDLTGPATPVILTPATTPFNTRTRRPAWTWRSGGGDAGGGFRYQLGSAAPVELAGTAFTPATDLADGTYVFRVAEKDGSGNWSTDAISTVTIKGSAPAAPTVTVNAAYSNAPRWNWSGTTGATFGYKVSGASTFLAEGTATSYQPTPAQMGEGARTICVAERDIIGYGAEACQTIIVDRTNPVIAITSDISAERMVTSVNPVFSGTVSDANLDRVECRAGTGTPVNATITAGTWSCTPALADGDINVTFTAIDRANNSASASAVTVHKRSRVVFVRKNRTGNGTSWANAYGDIEDVLKDGVILGTGTEVWVSAGTYQPSQSNAYEFTSNTSLVGGFSNSGAPYNRSDASPINLVTISSPAMWIGELDAGIQNLSFTNIVFNGNNSTDSRVYIANSTGIVIENCTFIGFIADIPLLIRQGSNVTVRGTTFKDNRTGTYGAILVDWEAYAEFINCTITGNTANANFSGGLTIFQTASATITGGTISGNRMTIRDIDGSETYVPMNIFVDEGSRLNHSGVSIPEGGSTVSGAGIITPPIP